MDILILHGWGQDETLWQGFAEKFSRHKVHTLDFPGFGKEKLISKSWGVPEYANWMEDAVKRKKLSNLVLIGHSFGGRVAAEIASKNPEYLKALIIIAAPLIYRPSTLTKSKIKLYKLLKPFLPARYKKRKDPMRKIFIKTVNHDQAEKLKKINAQTLIIWGEEDHEVPLKMAWEINSLIKNSQLKVLPKSGHNPHLDSADLLYGKINKFINDIK